MRGVTVCDGRHNRSVMKNQYPVASTQYPVGAAGCSKTSQQKCFEIQIRPESLLTCQQRITFLLTRLPPSPRQDMMSANERLAPWRTVNISQKSWKV